MCGECCGYPRSTDGGQNNAWPPDWPQSIDSWDRKVIEENLPVFKLINYNEKAGKVNINGKILKYEWVDKKGLCVSKENLQCPFLSQKLPDGTVPCLLYTKHKNVWDTQCMPTPPLEYETQEQVDSWFKNCPSCSYRYNE